MALKDVFFTKRTPTQQDVGSFMDRFEEINKMELFRIGLKPQVGHDLLLIFFLDTLESALKEVGETLPEDLIPVQKRLKKDHDLLRMMDESKEPTPEIKYEMICSRLLWFLSHHRSILTSFQKAIQACDVKNSEIYKVIADEARALIASEKK